MLPEDIQDIILAFILIILLFLIGTGFNITNFLKEDNTFETKVEMRDEDEIFLLNLLKTKVNNKELADWIIIGEENERTVNSLIHNEINKAVNKYGKGKNYNLKIIYPNKEYNFGCPVASDKIEQILPSLKKGIIKIEFGFRDLPCLTDIGGAL